jgi:hypothetical protein
MLIQDIEGGKTSSAVIDRTDPSIVVEIEIRIVAFADAVFGAVEMRQVLWDREAAVFGEAEEEAVLVGAGGGAFAGFPVDDEGGEGGEFEGAGAGYGAGLVGFLVLWGCVS